VAQTLMLVEKSDHQISWYNVETGALVGRRVRLPDFPHEFVVDAQNRYGYVGHYGVKSSADEGTNGRSVIVIDVAAQKILHTYDTGKHARPHGVGLDQLGRLYALSELTAHILVKNDPQAFDQGWDHITSTGGEKSHLFALSKDGQTCYSLNLDSGDVTVFNPHDASVEPISIETGDKPEGSHLTEDENTLYVANRGSGTIAVVDTKSKSVLRTFKAAPDCCRIYHESKRNRLLTINYLDQSFSVFDEAKGNEIHRLALPARALAMNVDPDEKFAYVAVDCGQVHRVDLESFQVVQIIETGQEPDVMHILPDGFYTNA